MRRQVKRLEKSLGGRGKAFSLLDRHLLQERENRRIAAQAAQNPPQFRHRGISQDGGNQPPREPELFTKRCFSFHQTLLLEALHLIIK